MFFFLLIKNTYEKGDIQLQMIILLLIFNDSLFHLILLFFYIPIVMEKYIQNRKKKLNFYRFLFRKIILFYQMFIERKRRILYIQWLQKLIIQHYTFLFLGQTPGKEESQRVAVLIVMFSIVSSLLVYIPRSKYPSCDPPSKKESSSNIFALPKIDHTVGEKLVSSIAKLQEWKEIGLVHYRRF
jgi:hypothetical protein